MAILAVGGEAECFEIPPPGDKTGVNMGSQGLTPNPVTDPVDAAFSRTSCTFTVPCFLNFVDPQGARTVWFHFSWNSGSGGPVFFGPAPGAFTFMRDDKPMARLYKNRTLNRYFIQTTPDNGVSWVDRGTGFVVEYFNQFRDWKRYNYDIKITFGTLFEVYRNGAKIDSFYGGWPTQIQNCNRIGINIQDGYFSELIVADETSIGMRLLTANASFGITTDEWDNSATFPPNGNYGTFNDYGCDFSSYASCSTPNQSQSLAFIYSPPPSLNINVFDGGWEVLGIAMAAIVQNIPGSNLSNAKFFLTNNTDQYYESPLIGAVPDNVGRRAQYIWSRKPLSNTPWTYQDAQNLQVGIISQ